MLEHVLQVAPRTPAPMAGGLLGRRAAAQTVQGGWLQLREGDPFFLEQLEDFPYKKTPAQTLFS